MSLDVEMSRVASDTLEKLKVVWDEIGSSQDARRDYVDKMAQDVLAVYESYYEKAVVQCNTLKQQIADQMHYLQQMAQELGERELLSYSDIEQLCLSAQAERITERLDTLEQTRAERAVHLEALVEQLRTLQQELGKELEYTYLKQDLETQPRSPTSSGYHEVHVHDREAHVHDREVHVHDREAHVHDREAHVHDREVHHDESVSTSLVAATPSTVTLSSATSVDELSSIASESRSATPATNVDLVNTTFTQGLNVSLDSSSNFSLQHIKNVEDCLAKAKEEKKAREQEVVALEADLQDMIAELGCTEDVSMATANRLHEATMVELRSRVQALSQVRGKRETQLADLAGRITILWDKLSIEPSAREAWLQQYNGKLTEAVIVACESELSRLQEEYSYRVASDIETATNRLHVLWDELSIPQLDRTLPDLDGLHDDDKLSAILNHKSSLEKHLAAIRPLIELINERESLYAEKADFEEKASNPNRLLSKKTKRDPGWLLKEEQIRKSFTTKIPKVDAALRKGLLEYQHNHHAPFLYNGEPYLDRMMTQEEKEKRKKEEEKSRKDKEKAQQLEKELLYGSAIPAPAKTPSKSRSNVNTTIISNTPITPRAPALHTSAVQSAKRKRPALSPISTNVPSLLTPQHSPKKMAHTLNLNLSTRLQFDENEDNVEHSSA